MKKDVDRTLPNLICSIQSSPNVDNLPDFLQFFISYFFIRSEIQYVWEVLYVQYQCKYTKESMRGERSRGSSVPPSSATLSLIGLLILPTAQSTTMLVTDGIHDWIPCSRDWQNEWVGFPMYSHWHLLSALTSSHWHHHHYYYSDLHAHVTSLYITTVPLKGREEALPLNEKKHYH